MGRAAAGAASGGAGEAGPLPLAKPQVRDERNPPPPASATRLDRERNPPRPGRVAECVV